MNLKCEHTIECQLSWASLRHCEQGTDNTKIQNMNWNCTIWIFYNIVLNILYFINFLVNSKLVSLFLLMFNKSS